jgi:hypothetical protein
VSYRVDISEAGDDEYVSECGNFEHSVNECINKRQEYWIVGLVIHNVQFLAYAVHRSW